MRALSRLLLSLALAAAAASVLCVSGSRVSSELDLSLHSGAASAPAPFTSRAHYATLHAHVTYEQAERHCNYTHKGFSLCSAASLCPTPTPLGGVRSQRALVPVKDGAKRNRWLSIGPDRTCEVVDGGKWGMSEEHKAFKGLVACCDAMGAVQPASLSQWEGFLIKRPDLASVFMVELGVRRGIPSPKSFEAMGFQWSRVKVLPAAVVEAIPLGKTLSDYSHKAKDSQIFQHALLGFEHEGGNPFELYEGFLVKKPSSPTICMIESLSKRCVPNAETFEALGFDWQLIQVVDAALYDAFPAGAAFESRSGAAPNSEPFVHALLGKEHFGVQTLQQTAIGAEAFVSAAVKRVLEREATPAEKAALLPKLRASRHVPTLIETLAVSSAFQSRYVWPELVTAVYAGVLERKPNADERKQMLEHFQQVHRSKDPTKNVKQVVMRLAQSEEHQTRFLTKPGVSSLHAARTLYKHLLGRDAESDAAAGGHAAAGEKHGWKVAMDGFFNSPEYKAVVGLHGVPGHPNVYAPAIKALFKKLLNIEAAKIPAAQLATECADARKHGWQAYVADFILRKEYLEENGNKAFMDERDHSIALRDKPSTQTAAKTAK